MPLALTPEHKRKMQEGRERALKRKQKRAVERVLEYRRWIKEHAPHSFEAKRLENLGFSDAQIKEKIGSPPRMTEAAAAVTDQDYKMAREAGAI